MVLDETLDKGTGKKHPDQFSLKSLFIHGSFATISGYVFTTPMVDNYFFPLSRDDPSDLWKMMSFATGFGMYFVAAKGVPFVYRTLRKEIDSYRENDAAVDR